MGLIVRKKDAQHLLLDFVQRQTQADAVELIEFRQLTGGAIQENHALTVVFSGGTMPGEQAFVVRCDAPSSLSVSLTRAQEFHILRAAHEAGVTAPKPYWLCQDAAVLGSPFYIMQRVAGTASGHALVRAELTADQRSALVFRLGQELARLHQVRPPQADLSFLTFPQASAALDRVQAYRDMLAHSVEPHPVVEWALRWLELHAPKPDELVLCHGDFRTGNFMVQDMQITAILDWEFSAWSDPNEDLGWLCARSWRFGCTEWEAGGIGNKTDLFAGYADIAGRPVDPSKVLYWEVMACVRWAVIALQQAQRHLSGEQQSLELALTGRMLPEIEMDILAHLRAVQGAL